MAIEFGSRKETFDNFKVYETMLAGRPFKVEMGKMCGLSNASALIRYGETCVMCNVVMSPKPREGVDFFPLNVEYEEKLYAAGRIPGSFMRREGRPGERAILTSRVVDRPMRPLFPKEMRNDVCITMTVMSLDPDCSPEIAGMIGASLVTAVSDIPWNGPIGGVQVDGHVFVSAVDQEDAKRAIFTIKTIVEDPEIGAIYKGKVTRLMNFGAFVEIAPGKEGLVHISKLDTKRVERVEDVVAVGDAIVVKVTDIDQQGRINLSRRDAILALEAKKAAQQQ